MDVGTDDIIKNFGQYTTVLFLVLINSLFNWLLWSITYEINYKYSLAKSVLLDKRRFGL